MLVNGKSFLKRGQNFGTSNEEPAHPQDCNLRSRRLRLIIESKTYLRLIKYDNDDVLLAVPELQTAGKSAV